MGHERLPKQLLYSQQKMKQQNPGRSQRQFKGVAKRNIKWRDIKNYDWQWQHRIVKQGRQSFNRIKNSRRCQQRATNDDDWEESVSNI